MKKLIWLMLLVITTVGMVSCSGFIEPTHQPLIRETVKVEKSETQVESKELTKTPQVSASRLFNHIQRLNFTRYTPAERSRTRSYITSELKELGWKPKLEKFTDGVNILAERQGSDKEAGTILVAAHYDTVYISPGADDNASGVAVVLEIARLLGSYPTPRTLQLAFFDREEAGLIGSKAFVSKKAHLQNLRGVIVVDMIGFACHTVGCQKYPVGLPVTPPSTQGDFLAIISDVEHSSLLSAFENSTSSSIALNKRSKSGSLLPPILTLPIPFKGLLTPDVLRSDHAPFWYQGVGAVLVTDTANLRTPHYHQSSDTLGTIDRKFFTGSAQIVVNATLKLLENE
ncbi:M28 family peptidase [Aetokthonos hydrillicola Thurmond2011]|jgi:hypothetical protein|uniref:M28 family peptidase n=1 Tax=Aetokthonos hydrillicola Thurmond2011 TaxID=2712845 RepID=A0AAP5MCJ2_9CYAN|nr:M28 family peptidase [Aetokthonos hydrillicola]MBO3462742.1 M28 family peptidase [Aetokthonos hydrillicola CCALA 1050]MBW4585748.1 M28 family peptidase [Aetokthonos hydrillicola CCALA 1050]MDR9899252.1 M28 family peptidase [Aetokthonos hydrillicola Thurmond2011]